MNPLVPLFLLNNINLERKHKSKAGTGGGFPLFLQTVSLKSQKVPSILKNYQAKGPGLGNPCC
jgi:hypothetical protein